MRDAGSRPMGRLFYLGLAGWMVCAMAYAAAATPQTGPATTTISDSVYLADGTPAAGSLIITWPAFVTASGAEVAAGASNVTLGANGALSVALVPNAGASPAGVYYSVVYQLGPGEVKTDARNTARQDSEIETTKARVVRLEQIAATNTEGRIRTEEELTKLREGQAEIKVMIQAHDTASRAVRQDK